MIMVWVYCSKDNFQVASFKAEKVLIMKQMLFSQDEIDGSETLTVRKKIILVLHVMKESVMELHRTTIKPTSVEASVWHQMVRSDSLDNKTVTKPKELKTQRAKDVFWFQWTAFLRGGVGGGGSGGFGTGLHYPQLILAAKNLNEFRFQTNILSAMTMVTVKCSEHNFHFAIF